ncbi:cation transporter, partial [Candidatus Roizmanbacteria bacterium]|nr:cation transporter [Candidatus Roizmanbacteria bacterium]
MDAIVQPFTIKGMHCESCVRVITRKLNKLTDVTHVAVSLEDGVATVTAGREIGAWEIADALKDTEYVVESDTFPRERPTNGNGFIKHHIRIDEQAEQVKLVIHTTTTAEGKVTGQGETTVFEGKIDTNRSCEITLPQNEAVSKEYIASLVRAVDTSEIVNRPLHPVTPSQHPVGSMESASKQKAMLTLSGMHCTSCANLITLSLKETPGVIDANVNFAAEKATVTYDESELSVSNLIKAVEKTGYKAALYDAKDTQYETKKRQEEIRNYRKKFINGFILSLPMIFFMLLEFFSFIPGRALLFPYIGVISLVLTIPVQLGIGADFYRGMWSALRMKTFNMDSLIAIGTSVAFVYSVINFLLYVARTGSIIGISGEKIPELYFETAAFLITFVVLGKWLEAKAKGETSDAI